MTTSELLLKRLGLSESESSLYLAMLSRGALQASELVKITRGKRPTVYYALRQLLSRGLVKNIATHGVQRFQAEPPESLLRLVELQEAELKNLHQELSQSMDAFRQTKKEQEGAPIVTFYQGVDAMKAIVMETIYCKNKHIDSIAPRDNFFWQVGQAFSQQYIDERVRRNITTRNLWEQPLKPEILTKSYKGLSEVRIVPEIMHHQYKSTVFLYDDKVMFISSVESAHVLVVQSREFYQSMKAMYDGLWLASKPMEM